MFTEHTHTYVQVYLKKMEWYMDVQKRADFYDGDDDMHLLELCAMRM